MMHFALAFGYIGHLHAIRSALNYDLRDLSWSEHVFTGGAARLWDANMRAALVAYGVARP